MNKKNPLFIPIGHIVLIGTLIASTGMQATTQNPKEDSVGKLAYEMKIFREGLKAAKKCLQKKGCSSEEKKAMYRATKHGIVIISLLAAITGGAATSIYFLGKKRKDEKPSKAMDFSNIPLELIDDIKKNQLDEALKKLINKKFSQEDLNKLLTITIFHGTKEAVEMVLKQGASATFITPDESQNSTLHGTVFFQEDKYGPENKARIIELLVEKGAPIDHQTANEKITALMMAASIDNLPVVEKLLELGASKTLRDASSKTAYDHAIESNASEEIKRALSDTRLLDID